MELEGLNLPVSQSLANNLKLKSYRKCSKTYKCVRWELKCKIELSRECVHR